MKADKEKLLAELAELERKKAELKLLRPHDFYKPFPGGQQRFWNDPRKEKVIFGSNQAGKTTTLINYVIRQLKKVPGSRWYLGSTSMDRSRKVTQKTFRDWINKEDLDPNSRYRDDMGFTNDCAVMRNGSICFFMSYEMDQDKWASDTLDGVGFDEEPPWHIFTESQKRIIVKNGELVCAMTALKSFTRYVNRVYLGDDPNIGLFTVPISENHVRVGGKFTDERIAQIIAETPESERPSRIYGIPTYRTGLIFDEWKDEYPWVIPKAQEFAIPHNWPRYCAVDPHASLPQAAVMIAVSPKHEMFLYKELWTKMFIPQFARELKKHATPIDFEIVLIDNHYSTQKNAETGKTIKQLLVEYGDIFTVGGCDDVHSRIDMLKQWDRLNPITKRPLLQTFESCVQTRWERKRYEWQSPVSERIADRRDPMQKPKAKDGHLMDCTCYLAAHGGKDGLDYVMPTLPPELEMKEAYYLRRAKEESEKEREEFEYDPENYTDPFMETISAEYE